MEPEAMLERVPGKVCPDCGVAFTLEDFEGVTLYECGDCGTIFSQETSYTGGGHQCPDCFKFASRYSTEGCPACQAAEVEDAIVFVNLESGDAFADEEDARA